MRVFSMSESPWGVVSGSVCFLILLEATSFISSKSILFRTISCGATNPAHTKDVID